MTDEVQVEVVAEAPREPSFVTVTSEIKETPPPEVAVAKVFTQEELDAAIGKRLAREQRKWERERAVEVPPTPVEPPRAEQYESTEAYVEALAEQKAAELVRKRDAQRQLSEVTEAYAEREDEARNKYDDFEQVAYNPGIRITEAMAEVIRSSEIGPDLAYHLGSNPKEADRISRLSPFLQAKEVGKLEARLTADPPTKKMSKAPVPISPVKPRNTDSSSYDTTDPRSVKAMTTSEWIAADRARQVRNLEHRLR